MEMNIDAIVEKVDFSKIELKNQFLVPVVTQCIETDKVLMQAYMNEEALRETIMTRKVTYWSRSKNELWVKGKTSGCTQDLEQMYLDCDYDSIMIRAVQHGGGACHFKDRYSCFDNGRVI
ncbi:MAG: phosphoribosyl-AMP cyclohydrolase [bacterium]|nr:phosphoribosyl-AMP cyclohydrolase [bacterium]